MFHCPSRHSLFVYLLFVQLFLFHLSSSFDVARVCGSGGDITTCRKFVQGDRVSAMIDTAEGWCNVAINGDEISHR